LIERGKFNCLIYIILIQKAYIIEDEGKTSNNVSFAKKEEEEEERRREIPP
jgi:hypothetical protein